MKTQNITQEYLKECLSYNQLTGEFIRKKRPLHHFKDEKGMKVYNKRFVGLNPCMLHKKGYYQIKIQCSSYKAHRLAWLYVYGIFPSDQIDHINGVKNDNRIGNLREATQSQNQQNTFKCRVTNVSGYLGAHYRKDTGKYRASITINKKSIKLGNFDTAIEAHHAYLKAKRKYHEYCEI